MSNYSQRYDQFFLYLLENEGWLSDDKLDSGGKTLMGISENNFPQDFHEAYHLYEYGLYNELKEYVKRFYYKNFYNQYYDLIVDSSLAFKLFDFGVNAGVRKAVKLLQKVINENLKKYYNKNNKLKVDGRYGEVTHQKLNLLLNYQYSIKNIDNSELPFYHDYIKRIEKFYKSLWNFFRFGKGWMRRLKKVFNGKDYFVASKDIRHKSFDLIK